MGADIIVTGMAEVDKLLRTLPERVQNRIGRSALSKTCTMLKRELKAAAPVGKTKAVRKSIGSRVKAGDANHATTAKVGINVGKRVKKDGKYAPHGHLVALGTQERRTQSGANRGRMPANHFVREVYDKKKGAAQEMMKTIILTKLDAEVAKARKR